MTDCEGKTDKKINLSVEVDDGEFRYSYEIGGSKARSIMPLNADALCLFVDLLRKCHEHWRAEEEAKDKKSWALAMDELKKRETK